MSGLRRAGAGLALALVVLTGCGGDNEDPGAGSDEAATSGSSAAPTTEPADDSATEGGGSDEFCSDMEAVEEKLRAITDVPDITTDPQAGLTAFRESLDAVRSVEAPSEIADDWATLETYLDTVTTGLENLDASDPGQLVEQMEELSNQLEDQSAEFDAAATRIDTYLKEECGIVLE